MVVSTNLHHNTYVRCGQSVAVELGLVSWISFEPSKVMLPRSMPVWSPPPYCTLLASLATMPLAPTMLSRGACHSNPPINYSNTYRQ